MTETDEQPRLDGEEAMARLRADPKPDEQTILVLSRAVFAWHQAGHLKRALEGGEVLLDSLVRSRGAHDEEALSVRANLAWTCREMELFDRAAEYCDFLFGCAEELGVEMSAKAPEWRIQAQMLLARLHYSQGRFEEARRLDEEAVIALEATDLRDRLLAGKSNLATTLWQLDELEAARALEEEILEEQTELHGAESLRTVQAGQNLLWTLWSQGEEDEVARRLPALKRIAEAVCEPCSQPLLSLRELEAKLVRYRERHEEARSLYQALLDDYSAALGAEHERAQMMRMELALAEQDLGQHERAIELLEEVVRIDREKRGPDHPKTLERLARLAGAAEDAADWKRAFAHHQDLLEWSRASRSEDDEEILQILYRLGAAAMEIGDHPQTIAVLEATLTLSRKLLGPEHEQTVLTVSNLAAVMIEDGSCEAGEDLYRWVHSVREISLGAEEKATWSTLVAAGHRLLGAGRPERAAACLYDGLQAAETSDALHERPSQHGFDALAGALVQLGHMDKAFMAHQRATEALESAMDRGFDVEAMDYLEHCFRRAVFWIEEGDAGRVLDLLRDRFDRLEVLSDAADHRIIQLLEFFAKGHFERDEAGAAIEVSERAITRLTDVHGTTGRETLRAKINHAYLLLSNGSADESLKLGLETLDAQVSIHGEEDPNTLVGMSSVAMILSSCGRTELGLPLLRRCLELRRATLDSDHPDVLATQERLDLLERRMESEPGGADRPPPKKSWWRKLWDGPVN